jgi:soluble lytic murein transglycosylase-like protein
MQSLRVIVRCVSLAVVAGLLGFACGWTGPVDRYPGREIRSPTPAADPVPVPPVQPETERLHRGILAYVVERNPHASMRAFRDYPAVLLGEAARTNIDHCVALAQAQVESNFKPDAVGAAGEIGLYQLLPSTAVLFERELGTLRRPSPRKYEPDLGDLADPVVSTRFAMAYLRDILGRKRTVRDALIEYNGGPRARQPHYYRLVMTTYVEILERAELGCRFRDVRPPRFDLARG